MTVGDFSKDNLSEWDRIAQAFGDTTREFVGTENILTALEPFMGVNLNVAYLPGGGTSSFADVRISEEPGCIDFDKGGDCVAIMKPLKLTLEQLGGGESFLLLELDALAPTSKGSEEGCEENHLFAGDYEQVLKLGPGSYDAIDTAGVPEGEHLVERFLKGKVLFVAKASAWNRCGGMVDGRHDRMDSREIREWIERYRSE